MIVGCPSTNHPLADIVYYFNTLLENWEARLSFGFVMGWLSSILGLDAEILASLTSLMIIDYFVGLSAAVKTKSFAWRVFVRGASKFFAYYVTIYLIGTITPHLPPWFLNLFPVMSIALAYLFSIEAGSIIRHLSVLGVQFPTPILRIVEKLPTKLEKAVNERLHEAGIHDEPEQETEKKQENE